PRAPRVPHGTEGPGPVRAVRRGAGAPRRGDSARRRLPPAAADALPRLAGEDRVRAAPSPTPAARRGRLPQRRERGPPAGEVVGPAGPPPARPRAGAQPEPPRPGAGPPVPAGHGRPFRGGP